MNGLRIGTPELVRWGMNADDAERLAQLIKRGLTETGVAQDVAEWRRSFDTIRFVH